MKKGHTEEVSNSYLKPSSFFFDIIQPYYIQREKVVMQSYHICIGSFIAYDDIQNNAIICDRALR